MSALPRLPKDGPPAPESRSAVHNKITSDRELP